MNADDIRVYYTGAKSAGSDQADSAKSVGGFVSGTLMPSLAYRLNDAISGVFVAFVSSSCGEGIHAIEATDDDDLRFTASGDTQGDAVTIAHGETKTLYSGTATKYIIVKRETVSDLDGSMIVATSWARNNAAAMDNADASDSAEVRMVAITNQSDETASLVASPSGSSFMIAWETAISDGFLRDLSVEGDESMPSGISFGYTIIHDLAAGETVGLWIKRDVSTSLDAGADIEATINLFCGGSSQPIKGLFALADSSLVQYELYRGVDVEIDFGAAAFETFAALPHDTAALAGGHTYKFVLRQRNAYDLLSQNLDEWEVTTEADGSVARNAPRSPDEIEVTPVYGNKFLIEAAYDYMADDEADRADTWLIYIGEDADPDPATVTPVEVAMSTGGGIVELSYLTAAYSDSTVLHVLVRTRRTDEADSVNTAITTATALGDLDAIRPGCEWITGSTAAAVVNVWTSGTNRIDVDATHGWIRFILGGSVVAGVTRAGIMLGSFVEGDLTGTAQAETFVLDGTDLCVAVGGYRVMSITTAGIVTIAAITETGAVPSDVWASSAHYEETGGELSFSADLETALFKISNAGLMTIRSGNEQ